MSHPFKHFVTITKHRHQVIRNAAHMGIFFHALRHDLSNYPRLSSGLRQSIMRDYSPVYKERINNIISPRSANITPGGIPIIGNIGPISSMGRILMKTMPYKWATEYVCDMLSASKTYDPKHFQSGEDFGVFQNPLASLLHDRSHPRIYRLVPRDLCRTVGWKGLKKKMTKPNTRKSPHGYPRVEVVETLKLDGICPLWRAKV
jgi:hypothetical protein